MAKVPEIAVWGYYQKQNYGDELLRHAIVQLFPECCTTFFGGTPNPRALNTFDHVIIGGGSLLPNAHLRSYVRDGRLAAPWSLLGISVREGMGESERQILLRDASVVVVRDSASKRALGNDAKIVVGPDLSWLVPADWVSEPPNENVVGLNLRYWKRTAWDARAIVQAAARGSARVVGLPLYSGGAQPGGGDIGADCDVLEAAGVACPRYLNATLLSGIRLVIGMRFHSLVLAAQAGIPFVGFDYHPKTRAFCGEMGMTEFCIPLGEPNRLSAAIAKLEAHYDDIRHKLFQIRLQQIECARGIYAAAKEQILASPRPPRLQGLARGISYRVRRAIGGPS